LRSYLPIKAAGRSGWFKFKTNPPAEVSLTFLSTRAGGSPLLGISRGRRAADTLRS